VDGSTPLCLLLREDVPLMVKNTIDTAKVMITVCFEDEALICVDTLDPNEILTQDWFIDFVLSDPKKHAQAKTPDRTGCAHGHSRCNNG
jgi:hypothetical protein